MPHLAKILELLVYGDIKQSLNYIFFPQQYGLKPSKSIITCSVYFFYFISDSLDNGYQVDIILINFSQIFDTVYYGLLIRNLEFLGIGEPFLCWLTLYLTGRSKFVKVDNRTLKLVRVSSGVP